MAPITRAAKDAWTAAKAKYEQSIEHAASASPFERCVNRPGMSGDFEPWEGWSHVRENIEEVPA
jgi:hypothetical protein